MVLGHLTLVRVAIPRLYLSSRNSGVFLQLALNVEDMTLQILKEGQSFEIFQIHGWPLLQVIMRCKIVVVNSGPNGHRASFDIYALNCCGIMETGG